MKDATPIVHEARALIFEDRGRVRLGVHPVGLPPPDYLRIRVVACGVCQREWHVLHGTLPRAFPAVMGHEFVGIVDAIGARVNNFKNGQWVTGVGQASLADYDLVEARFAARLPGPPQRPEHFLGEPVMCAVNAVNRLSPRASSTVVVNGAGFMGNLVIQSLHIKTPTVRVIAVDPDPVARNLAVVAGAAAAEPPDLDQVNRLIQRPVDAVVEASGAPGTIKFCTDLLRNGGTLAVFAHHFAVEPAVVSDWHLRGITILNTVPWAAPDLGREVREAVSLLCRGDVRLSFLPMQVLGLEAAVQVMHGNPKPCVRKVVVMFDGRTSPA